MTTKTPARIEKIEDAATARWLARTLEPARARIETAPSAEAVDRIRARVLDAGAAAARRPARRLAA
jgi:hypothetical protein